MQLRPDMPGRSSEAIPWSTNGKSGGACGHGNGVLKTGEAAAAASSGLARQVIRTVQL